MANRLVSEAISTARRLLNDESAPYRWSDAELIGDLNDGQIAIAAADQKACVKHASFTLSAQAKQTLPGEALGLIDVYPG